MPALHNFCGRTAKKNACLFSKLTINSFFQLRVPLNIFNITFVPDVLVVLLSVLNFTKPDPINRTRPSIGSNNYK